jgi:hypothetical protein
MYATVEESRRAACERSIEVIKCQHHRYRRYDNTERPFLLENLDYTFRLRYPYHSFFEVHILAPLNPNFAGFFTPTLGLPHQRGGNLTIHQSIGISFLGIL